MARSTCRFSRAAGRAASAVLLLGLAAAPARAADSGLTLQDGWFRMLIAARPAAGYFTLHNAGDTAQALTGASSPACGSLMLHQSVHQGSQERMVMVKQVAVPAKGTLQFAPSGYHLMCMQPKPAMKVGGQVPVTLRFGDGSTLQAEFAVQGAVAR